MQVERYRYEKLKYLVKEASSDNDINAKHMHACTLPTFPTNTEHCSYQNVFVRPEGNQRFPGQERTETHLGPCLPLPFSGGTFPEPRSYNEGGQREFFFGVGVFF